MVLNLLWEFRIVKTGAHRNRWFRYIWGRIPVECSSLDIVVRTYTTLPNLYKYNPYSISVLGNTSNFEGYESPTRSRLLSLPDKDGMYQWLYPVVDRRCEPRGECVLDQVDPECDRALQWVRREAVERCCETLCRMVCWNECALRVNLHFNPFLPESVCWLVQENQLCFMVLCNDVFRGRNVMAVCIEEKRKRLWCVFIIDGCSVSDVFLTDDASLKENDLISFFAQRFFTFLSCTWGWGWGCRMTLCGWGH